MLESPGERIRAALASVAVDPIPTRYGWPVAVGWATVELDRAARELAADLGLANDVFAPAQPSQALGARCRIARGALPGDVALAILEPATEGRLAASLARRGEGPAAVWIASVVTASPDTAAVAGPFGPERAVPGSVDGVDLFLIEPAAGTIPP